jgi:hypothetical protein
MPRSHEFVIGEMRGNVETPDGNYVQDVEVRIIRGDRPHEVSILLPNFDRYVEERDDYSWIDPHQVNGINVIELVDALVGLGQLEHLPNGSYRIPDNPTVGKY